MSTSTQSTIDFMVAQSLTNSTGPRGNTTPDLRVNTSDGSVELMGNASAQGSRLVDDPQYDPVNELAQLDASIASLDALLTEQTFDQKTGMPSARVTGRDREVLELQRASALNAKHYAAMRGAVLIGQRESDLAAKRQADTESAARQGFTGGDPTRAALLDKAITEEEAREAARTIVAARRRG
jgi:hypothetical protein